VTVTFTAPAGTHRIALNTYSTPEGCSEGIADTEGRWSIVSLTTEVAEEENEPPVAAFTWEVADDDPLTVAFDASGSTDDEGIVSYAWDFGGDGTGSGEAPSHTFSSGGTYDVTLTVTDAEGLTDDLTERIDVASCPSDLATLGFTPLAVRVLVAARVTLTVRVRNAVGGGVRNVRIEAQDSCGGPTYVSEPTNRDGYVTLEMSAEVPSTVVARPLLSGRFQPELRAYELDAGTEVFSASADFSTPESCFHRPVTVLGTESAESIDLYDGDVLSALGGDDAVGLADLGGDTVSCGGEGNDTFFAGVDATGVTWVDGGSGHDTVHGGAGDDLLTGGPGVDTIGGGVGADTIAGGSDADILAGGDDRDVIRGDGGRDTITGGDGSDELYGGNELDEISGEAGNDGIWGEAGNDTLTGGAGADAVAGGDGPDRISGGDGSDLINGEGESDLLLGDAGDDGLLGGEGNDVIEGGAGCDGARGEAGDDTIGGGDGADAPSELGGCSTGGLDGGFGNDTITGGSGRDQLLGRAGCDALSGDDAADTIDAGTDDDGPSGTTTACSSAGTFGGPGADTVFGGPGADRIEGGAGSDVLWGDSDAGLGATAGGPDTIDGGPGGDTIRGGDEPELPGCGMADSIDGGEGRDTIEGGDGGDTILAGDGNDTARGDDGCDKVYGGDGRDVIYGGDNPDGTLELLFGEGDMDAIFGGVGRDGIRGGEGRDTINGEADDDIIDGGVLGLRTVSLKDKEEGKVDADEVIGLLDVIFGRVNDVDSIDGGIDNGGGGDRCARRVDSSGRADSVINCETVSDPGPNVVWAELAY
jgi:Ca2+-binding RTX toxin-like protein